MFYVYAALGLLGAVFYSRRFRTPRHGAAAPASHAVGSVAPDRLQARRTIQSGFVCRRLSPFNPSSPSGCSNVSNSRLPPRAAFFSGRMFSPLSRIRWRRASAGASASSTPWSLPTFHRASVSFSRRSRPDLTIVLGLLLVRSALSQMDVPTRTSYVMAVVTPAERTAAASVTAVPRSLASAISPALSGALLSTSFAALPLVICGVLKIVYDVSLLFSFRHIKPPRSRRRDPSAQVIEAAHVADFGKHREAPASAVVHFEGDDPQAGPLDSIHDGDAEEMIPVNVTGRTDAQSQTA